MDKIKFTEKKYLITLLFVTFLFLLWGIALSMSDVLNKHFQNVLAVSKSKSGLIQMSVFGAYLIMSIPAGIFMKKYGYKYGILLGLFLFAAGALLFLPAANNESFNGFRAALFVLGCGMATLETVAHPFMAALGDQRSSDRRINLAQSFNAVGTIIGPAIGAYFLLRSSTPGSNLDSVKHLYLVIALVIIAVLVLFSLLKVPSFSGTDPHQTSNNTAAASEEEPPLIKRRHFVWAVIAQFFNVAAQAGTWAFFINYGHEVMKYSDQKAAAFMSLFMACMAAGRFTGTFLMKYIAPNRLLALFAAINVIMCFIVAQGWGTVSYVSLFLVNFFFSIMYPTIFSLGLKDLGGKTQLASSFLSMGMAGGAVFPLVMGLIANHNVAHAYYLPIICYTVVFLFGYRFYKPIKAGKPFMASDI